MLNVSKPMIFEVIPPFWRGSEDAVYKHLQNNSKSGFKTIICLRRKQPGWWLEMENKFQIESTFIHFPIPPSHLPYCFERIQNFIQTLSKFNYPVIYFCKKGKNRTGIISSILRYQDTNSFFSGITEYFEVAQELKRNEDINIIKSVLKELCKPE